MVPPLELRRKMFHIIAGVLFMALFYFGRISARGLFVILVAGGIASYISRTHKIPVIWWFLTRFERPQHLASFPGKGAWFFVLGFLLSSTMFEKDVALAAMSVLVIGDSLSHLIGATFGSIRHPFSDRKFIEGHVAGALISSIIASYFVPFWIALSGAAAGMFMEGIDIVIHTDPVDDNVIIPLTAGAVMSLLQWI